MSTLESPADPDELYLARGDEVVPERPLITGDVIRGADLGSGQDADVMVLQHPCSMRRGAVLAPRLLVAAVTTFSGAKDWNGNFKIMPLPNLLGDGAWYAARFEDITQLPTELLDRTRRLACLSVRGINLLQQRLAHYMTRVVIETPTLNKAMEHVFEEVELLEDWVVTAVDRGIPDDQATEEFDKFIREGEPPRQELLRDPQARATVRRDARRAAAALYDSQQVADMR